MTATDKVIVVLGVLASIGMIAYIVVIHLAIVDILKNGNAFKRNHTK